MSTERRVRVAMVGYYDIFLEGNEGKVGSWEGTWKGIRQLLTVRNDVCVMLWRGNENVAGWIWPV